MGVISYSNLIFTVIYERVSESKFWIGDVLNNTLKIIRFKQKLQLTPYQELRVRFLVNHFGNDFKMLHGQAKTEAIILSFIFYMKINEIGRARLNDYKITGKYGLTDNIFEIIVCRLCEYYMQRTPIVPVGSTDYDHDILCRNGGKI